LDLIEMLVCTFYEHRQMDFHQRSHTLIAM